MKLNTDASQNWNPKLHPIIWIEIQQKGNQKIRFQKFYRQWQEVSQNGAIPETKSVPKQIIRFKNLNQNVV